LLWFIKAAFSGGSPAATPTNPPRTAPATNSAPVPARSYKLVAVDTVRIYVRKQIDGNTEGDDVIPPVTLSPGQTIIVPWNEAQFLWYSSGAALKLETNSGVRHDMPQMGTNRIILNPPR
jgi:hypothetical protein